MSANPAPSGVDPAAAADRDRTPAATRPSRPPSGISRRRLIAVDALIGLTTLLALVGMIAVWANRLLFNPDNWQRTSTQLLQNRQVRNATANYVVDQLYANVHVAALLRSGLPANVQPLAGPAAGALRNVAVQAVELGLTRPRIQQLWAKANRAADQTFIAVVNGGNGAVGVRSGTVTLNLASVVDEVAARLGLPPNLGAKLPANVANLTVFKSNQLRTVQNVANAVRSAALWLSILVPLLYALAVVLARGHRRRTLMSVGFAGILVGVLGVAGRSILESQLTQALVSDASLRPAVRAVVTISTELLAEIASAFILIGAVLVAGAWFAGPARLATAGRRAPAPFLREHPAAAFAITAAVMVLVFIWDPIPATGTPVGIIVFMALALLGTEVLRRQTAIEFRDAHAGETAAALRARVRAIRERRHAGAPSPPSSESLSVQLEWLAALRADGSITREEYDMAEGSLLGK